MTKISVRDEMGQMEIIPEENSTTPIEGGLFSLEVNDFTTRSCSVCPLVFSRIGILGFISLVTGPIVSIWMLYVNLTELNGSQRKRFF